MKPLGNHKEINTSSGKFLIRPYRFADKDSIIHLWEIAFKTKMNPKIWDWKFHDNPFGREIMICVNEEEVPVVMFSGIPFSANWNKQFFNATHQIDNMSHPQYRQIVGGRKGLFVKTAEHFFEVYGGVNSNTLHYGMPGDRHFRLGEIFLDYRKMPVRLLYLELLIKNLKIVNTALSYRKIFKVNGFDKHFDRFWQKAAKNFKFSVIRDLQFLDWRFSRHPKNVYDIYVLRGFSKSLKAYMVVLREDKLATIVDIISLKKNVYLKELLTGTLILLQKSGVERIRTWLPEKHFITSGMISNGFKIENEPLGIIPAFRYYEGNIDFSQLKDFYYNMADADLF